MGPTIKVPYADNSKETFASPESPEQELRQSSSNRNQQKKPSILKNIIPITTSENLEKYQH